MGYIVIGLLVLAAVGASLFFLLRNRELSAQVSALRAEVERQGADLAALERFRGVPDVIERARKARDDAAAKLDQARASADALIAEAIRIHEDARLERDAKLAEAWQRADEIVSQAEGRARLEIERLSAEQAAARQDAREALKRARSEARGKLAEAQVRFDETIRQADKEARQITNAARKAARERAQEAEQILNDATAYALEIRQKAEARVRGIAGEAYEALRRSERYAATAQAMENAVRGYGESYNVPPEHVLDDLADEFGFTKAGENLKRARDRTRIMQGNGTAATCNYPEGWKREYAINFVLSAFNGKVDSILARIKAGKHGQLIQEVKDAFALVNHQGEVFKDARIHQEYLDARLDELKWAVAVQKVKDRRREEQRAIREQMREEAKARREYERALKQAQKEEDAIARALEKARQEFERAVGEERARYEAQILDLGGKLQEAERNKRAISMAEQTKQGHVYVISNVGSFGEGVFKIGLTRRQDPMERVRELGDASVPFPFDVHAMIFAEEAPSLETALHRRFMDAQLNKINKRKEFFRISLSEIRQAVEEMGLKARWTLAADAAQYRESLALEQAMKTDAELRRRWVADQQQSTFAFDEDDAEEGEAPMHAGAGGEAGG